MGVTRFKSLFSYYGGKSKIAHRYPKPKFDHIIEPFAGGAGYSILYYERQVTLVERSRATAALWRYLLGTPLDTILRDVPETVEKGQQTGEMVKQGSDPGLLVLLSASASVGECGTYGVKSRAVTGYGRDHWPRMRRRLEFFLPKIQHWKLIFGDYTDAPDVEATWFCDPPYANRLGERYLHGPKDIDHQSLAKWCMQRKGQVIVCENAGATWLPFEPLFTVRNLRNKSEEVIWNGGA